MLDPVKLCLCHQHHEQIIQPTAWAVKPNGRISFVAYHVELKGSALSSKQSDTAAYVIQGSVSIETAIAERPTAALSVRVPPGVTLAPKDFDEAHHRLPGAAVPSVGRAPREPRRLLAARRSGGHAGGRFHGLLPLTYGGGTDLQYRAFRQETSAVPYGGAPEWSHTSGAGLSGNIGAVGAAFTIAGFVRLASGASRDSGGVARRRGCSEAAAHRCRGTDAGLRWRLRGRRTCAHG